MLRSASVTVSVAVSLSWYEAWSSATVPSVNIDAVAVRSVATPENVVLSAYVAVRPSPDATRRTSVGSSDAVSLKVAVPVKIPVSLPDSVRVTVMPVASDVESKVTSTVWAEPASVLRSASVTVSVAVSSRAYAPASSMIVPSIRMRAASERAIVPVPAKFGSWYVAVTVSPSAINRTSPPSSEDRSLKVAVPAKTPVSTPVSVSVTVMPAASEVEVKLADTVSLVAGSRLPSKSVTVIVAVSDRS